MRFPELERMLLENGYTRDLSKKGRRNSRFYRHPTRRPVMLHFHPSKEVPRGLLKKLLKDSGLRDVVDSKARSRAAESKEGN